MAVKHGREIPSIVAVGVTEISSVLAKIPIALAEIFTCCLKNFYVMYLVYYLP